jgi:hypothetical protein
MKAQLGDLRRYRETPCAAQPAGASAPPRAFQGREPSTFARTPGVTLRLEQFHRPSELALWRAIRFDGAHSPGFPDRLSRRGWFVRTGCPARRPQPADDRRPSRLVRLPSTSPTSSFPGFPVLTPPAANDSPPTPLPPREPGWTLERGHPPKGSTTHSRPFLGLRLACACRCVAYFARCVFPGQGVFLNTQGYPPKFPSIPRNFPFVHRPCTGWCTGLCTIRPSGRARLVDDGTATRHNRSGDLAAGHLPGQHHHHSLAHVDHHVRLQPSSGAAVSFLRHSPRTETKTGHRYEH